MLQMKSLSSMRIVRVSLALAVAFWMAGVGCLLGCESMLTAAAATVSAPPASSVTVVASGDACAAMQSHDCCAGRRAKPASKSIARPVPKVAAKSNDQIALPRQRSFEATATTGVVTDCPLAVNAAAALAKARSDQANGVVAYSSAGLVPSISNEQAAALAHPLRPPNRGHTYLRCCVFLI
jgi:hypothetical protein